MIQSLVECSMALSKEQKREIAFWIRNEYREWIYISDYAFYFGNGNCIGPRDPDYKDLVDFVNTFKSKLGKLFYE